MINIEAPLKICCTCKQEKPIDEFGKDRTSKTGYSAKCSKCMNDYVKAKHKQDPSIHRKRVKIWRKNNKEQHNANHKRRRDNNPEARLAKLLRDRIHSCFRGKGKRERHSVEVLGCSWGEFVKWFELHFKEGMTFQNAGKGPGKWHLEHAIPVSWANNEEEIYKLNHYTNLKPEWESDNLSKRNSFGEQWNGYEWIKITKESYDSYQYRN